MQVQELYPLFLQHSQISTDTRKIQEGCIFFALKGANFNGNAFAEQALSQGAAYAVVDEPAYATHPQSILVDDVLQMLQELARYHRQQLTIPVIGVTGTNGKTTTKELLYAVLAQKFKTFATQGNLNNHIGVPLSILSVNDTYEMAIIEMGANHVGEIAFLCDIAQPTHGLITNVGKAHLEGFGSFEGVKKAKGELYDYLQSHQGQLFVQANNGHLMEMLRAKDIDESTVISYGFSKLNTVYGRLITADPYLSIAWNNHKNPEDHEVRTQLTGSYNLENFLAAITVGLHFGMDAKQINQGIAQYAPQNNRSQITKTARNTVIADFYNANASSMSAALDNISALTAINKAIILGDMFELGDDSFREHALIVSKAKALGVERLLFVGQEFYQHRDDEAEFYATTAEAKDAVASISDSFVLLKASRGMAFEKLLDVL